MKFGVLVDESYIHDGMSYLHTTRSKVKAKVTRPRMLEILWLSESIYSAISSGGFDWEKPLRPYLYF